MSKLLTDIALVVFAVAGLALPIVGLLSILRGDGGRSWFPSDYDKTKKGPHFPKL